MGLHAGSELYVWSDRTQEGRMYIGNLAMRALSSHHCRKSLRGVGGTFGFRSMHGRAKLTLTPIDCRQYFWPLFSQRFGMRRGPVSDCDHGGYAHESR